MSEPGSCCPSREDGGEVVPGVATVSGVATEPKKAGKSKGIVAMYYVVRKRKGKYYLYKEWWDPLLKRKMSISLGNCEKIEAILRELKWRRGRDLNPGVRLDNGLAIHPQGKVSTRGVATKREGGATSKPVQLAEIDKLLAPHLTPDKINRFHSWLLEERGVSQDYASSLVRYLTTPTRSKYAALSRRAFLRFLEAKYGVDVSGLLEKLPVRQSKPDRRIPSEDEVLEAVIRAGGVVRMAYLLLLASGIRVSEAVYILSEWDPARIDRQEGLVVYRLDWHRGKKSAYVAVWPEWLGIGPAAVTSRWLSKQAERLGILRPKYLRKFVAQKMLALGISSDSVDFLQGRIPRKHVVLFTHYAELLSHALQEYARYAEWLRGFLAEAGVMQ